jgi:predicted RNA-binding protein with TRAM domain
MQKEYELSYPILDSVSYGSSFSGSSGMGFRDSPGPGPTPVEIGNEYELEVSEISRKGDGVARFHGFVIFVRKGTVGQKRKVKIDQIGSRFAIGTVVN